jgi:hypothetical protein
VGSAADPAPCIVGAYVLGVDLPGDIHGINVMREVGAQVTWPCQIADL